MCPEQLKNFKNVSLTRNTIPSGIDDMAENLRNQLCSIILTFETHFIAIDESTDVQVKIQLAVFIRRCDANLKISEELLKIFSLRDTATWIDIFNATMDVLNNIVTKN